MKKSICDVVYESARGLHKAGLIDQLIMDRLKALCLPKLKQFSSRKIKKLRADLKVSQTVFAELLNVSLPTIKKWEAGEKHPRGASLKLLNLVATKGFLALI